MEKYSKTRGIYDEILIAYLSDNVLLSRCHSIQMHQTHYYWLWSYRYTISITTVSICRTPLIQATDCIFLSIRDITATISFGGLVLPVGFPHWDKWSERQTDESSFPLLSKAARSVSKKDCFYSAIFSISLWAVSALVPTAVHQQDRSRMTFRTA